MINKGKFYLDKNDYKRFRHWLIDKDWTMNDFAKLIGVNPTKIHRYMTGQVSITPEVEKLFLRLGYRLIPVKQGNRLTENWDNEHYHLDANLWIATKEKLGQLENIEEELGIDLITLFKALKNGVYYKYKPYGYDYKISKCRKCFLTGNRTLVVDYHTYKYLCDYGKTWALTKEELVIKMRGN